jgi:hypothetical protein
MSIEAMKLALAEFEDQKLHFEDVGISFESIDNCITSLRKAIAEAESKRAALGAIIISSEKRNEEWDALSADEQAAYHAQNACPYCGGSGHKDDIAEAEKQEPVAGVVVREGLPTLLRDSDIKPTDKRLYTTPQQRTWVGLTDEEIDSMVEVTDLSGAYYYDDLYAVVRAAEAKLTEKNT